MAILQYELISAPKKCSACYLYSGIFFRSRFKKNAIIGSGETDMNRSGSHPDLKIGLSTIDLILKLSPKYGRLTFFSFWSPILRGGVPLAAAYILTHGISGNNPAG